MLCSLKEEGAVAIADFVKQGKKLTELNLYMNDIGDTGAYKVSHGLCLRCQSRLLVSLAHHTMPSLSLAKATDLANRLHDQLRVNGTGV